MNLTTDRDPETQLLLAVVSLPPLERQILVRHLYCEASDTEIASALCISRSTVIRRRHRAICDISEMLVAV
jgi:DNA-directed RNA polymerase specialized sigma24 family protein